MNPAIARSIGGLSCFLHMCGDEPPYRWDKNYYYNVFSICVEMNLPHERKSLEMWCFLHMCGDEPKISITYFRWFGFSPYVWR